jgi:hypothetical protein
LCVPQPVEWSRDKHHLFPVEFRAVVWQLVRGHYSPASVLNTLPMDVLELVIAHRARDLRSLVVRPAPGRACVTPGPLLSDASDDGHDDEYDDEYYDNYYDDEDPDLIDLQRDRAYAMEDMCGASSSSSLSDSESVLPDRDSATDSHSVDVGAADAAECSSESAEDEFPVSASKRRAVASESESD